MPTIDYLVQHHEHTPTILNDSMKEQLGEEDMARSVAQEGREIAYGIAGP